jgi:hypothetical protein
MVSVLALRRISRPNLSVLLLKSEEKAVYGDKAGGQAVQRPGVHRVVPLRSYAHTTKKPPAVWEAFSFLYVTCAGYSGLPTT